MATAHLLTDIGVARFTPEFLRIEATVAVLNGLGFDVKRYDDKFVDKNMAMNFETQLNVTDGDKAIFADGALGTLTAVVKKDDVVIASRDWHSLVFKGLLQETAGRFNDAPVIELWTDSYKGFAKYRIFSSRFTLACASAREDAASWFNPNWITVLPYVALMDLQSNMTSAPVDPHSLLFLHHMAYGYKTIAPAFGVFAEYLIHGKTGVLYRTERGKKSGQELLAQLKPEDIQEWIDIHCNLETVTETLRPYFNWVANA